MKPTIRALMCVVAMLVGFGAKLPAVRADETQDYIDQIYNDQKDTDDYVNQIYQDQKDLDDYFDKLQDNTDRAQSAFEAARNPEPAAGAIGAPPAFRFPPPAAPIVVNPQQALALQQQAMAFHQQVWAFQQQAFAIQQAQIRQMQLLQAQVLRR